mgnify:CR=1 FL=1
MVNRFRQLVGKTCVLPIMNRELPIVADEYVELGFGTGAVKMTPAHDPNDFEVGLRHNLESIRVIDDNGVINENGPHHGLRPGGGHHQIPAAVGEGVADIPQVARLVRVLHLRVAQGGDAVGAPVDDPV